MPIGFRVLTRQRAASAEYIERYRDLPVANISDSMQRMTAGGAGLRPFHRGGGLVGVALTVKCRPGDNLMLHHALNIAEPGDVIVVDAGGDLTNALIGELMLAFAAKKQLAGVVINGAVRDTASIAANDLPVYARGVTHRGPYKNGPGEINVPFDQVAAVYELAKARHLGEQAKLQAIAEGRNDRRWVLNALLALGCDL